MKVFLEVDIKPFNRESYRGYSGLYTPKGRKSQRARIEANSEEAQLDQVNSLFHEFGHFVCDIGMGETHKKSKHAYEREQAFCYAVGRASSELYRRMLSGKSLVGTTRVTVRVSEEDTKT